MTRSVSEERFRQAAEAEGGMPVSAGARASHFKRAAASGRMYYVDLTTVPEERRLALVDEIKALIERASVRPQDHKPVISQTKVEVDE